jgi:hypothetical protein
VPNTSSINFLERGTPEAIPWDEGIPWIVPNGGQSIRTL